jgi:hypothetical protein
MHALSYDMSRANEFLPFKRRFGADENFEDDEQWRVCYAEDIDDKRAELLRRLEFKARSRYAN